MRRFVVLCLFILTITNHAQTDIPPRPIITPQNAHQLTQIAQLGRGNILDFVFMDDGNRLRVLSTIGIWDYDMTDLSAPPVWMEMYPSVDDGLSSNGEFLLFNHNDSQLIIYHIQRKRIISQTDWQDIPINSLGFNPTSDKIFFMQQKTLYEWDFLNHIIREVFTIREDFPRIMPMKLSPDGKILAGIRYCMDEDCEFPMGMPHQLWLWYTATGYAISHFDTQYVSSIQFSDDSKTVFLSEHNNGKHGTPQIRQISIPTNSSSYPIRYNNTYDATYQQLVLSQDEQLMAISGAYESGFPHLFKTGIYIWDMNLSDPLLWLDLEYETSMVKHMQFHPSGRYLVTVGWDDILRVWDMSNGAEVTTIADHASVKVAISPDNRYIASGTSEGRIMIWDVSAFTNHSLPIRYPKGINYIGFTPDGRYLLVYDRERDSTMIAYDTITWQIHHDVYAPGLGWASPHVQFHPTKPLVAFSDRHNTTIVWNYETDETVFDGWNPMADMAQHQPVFTPDGDYLIYARQETDGTRLQLVVLDLHTQQFYKEIRHPKTILTVTLSPDGASLLVGLEDGQIWVWDVATWRFRHAIWGYMPFISPDSQNAIAPVPASVMYVYDLYTGEKISESWSPSKEVIGNPVFSPNSQVMVIATSFGMIHLENMQTGERFVSVGALPLGMYDWDALKMPQLAFSSDGTFITVADGGVIRVFGIPTD